MKINSNLYIFNNQKKMMNLKGYKNNPLIDYKTNSTCFKQKLKNELKEEYDCYFPENNEDSEFFFASKDTIQKIIVENKYGNSRLFFLFTKKNYHGENIFHFLCSDKNNVKENAEKIELMLNSINSNQKIQAITSKCSSGMTPLDLAIENYTYEPAIIETLVKIINNIFSEKYLFNINEAIDLKTACKSIIKNFNSDNFDNPKLYKELEENVSNFSLPWTN